jgi:hypothetical protein
MLSLPKFSLRKPGCLSKWILICLVSLSICAITALSEENSATPSLETEPKPNPNSSEDVHTVPEKDPGALSSLNDGNPIGPNDPQKENQLADPPSTPLIQKINVFPPSQNPKAAEENARVFVSPMRKLQKPITKKEKSPGDIMVETARNHFQNLDQAHPKWHHAGYSYFQPIFESNRRHLFSIWGSDIHSPEWLGWLEDSKTSALPISSMKKYHETARKALDLLEAAWTLEENPDAGYLVAQIKLVGKRKNLFDL